jgi:PadR family transcriptional regulator, regulatory protein AphA
VKLEHLLLGILLVKPRTGYDLARYMEMEGVFLRARTQMSQVYRSLTQMADRGWVTYTISMRPGAQDAKIYQATPAGRDAFMAWLHSPYQPIIGLENYEFRARLFFSGFSDEEELLDLLDAEIDARQRQIAKYRFRDRTIEVGPETDFDVDLATFVEDFQHESGASSMDMMVTRLLELRERVQTRVRERSDAAAISA